MPRPHPPYAPEYRRRMAAFARNDRTIPELAHGVRFLANAIRKWVKRAALDERLAAPACGTGRAVSAGLRQSCCNRPIDLAVAH
jgi:transposase-like protein